MQQIGRYQVERELGRGAMGIVYAGFDPMLKRPVAIKTLQRAGDSSGQARDLLIKRMAREAQSAAGLSHPNIVGVYDIVEEDGVFSVVMELVDGQSLAKAFPEGSPGAVASVLRTLHECAAALDHAHSRGVVHRDIKPANIMLDRKGTAKIADFGLAKLLDSTTDLTQGFVLGTLEYMSPEQLNAKTVDGRADQYSLAAVGYRLLTGSRLYDADNVGHWCHMVVSQPPVPATTRNSKLPRSVDDVFTRALAKNPSDRYPFCEAFAADLSRALNSTAADFAPTVTMSIPPAATSQTRLGWLIWTITTVLAVALVSVGIHLWNGADRGDGGSATVVDLKGGAKNVAGPGPSDRQGPTGDPKPITEPRPTMDPKPELAREAWERVKGSGNRAAIEAFLKAYSKSDYASAARVELALLTPPSSDATAVEPQPGQQKTNLKDAQPYVWIPPGKFVMGCSPQDGQCLPDEKPAHSVEIAQGFWMGQTPVTLGPWKRYRMLTNTPALAGSDKNGRKINGSVGDDTVPIVAMHWEQAQGFCEWAGGRLPTEAEWEYAARAGSKASRYGDPEAIAWYVDNAGKQRLDGSSLRDLNRADLDRMLVENGNAPHPVRQKQPNPWNLYDMLGNVLQWVSDLYGESYYRDSPSKSPQGPRDGKERIVRGASWFNPVWMVRASTRVHFPKDDVRSSVGFRCVLDGKTPKTETLTENVGPIQVKTVKPPPVRFEGTNASGTWAVVVDTVGRVEREADTIKVILDRCVITRPTRYSDPYDMVSISASISRSKDKGGWTTLRSSGPHLIRRTLPPGEKLELPSFELGIQVAGLKIEPGDWLTFSVEGVRDNNGKVTAGLVYTQIPIQFPQLP